MKKRKEAQSTIEYILLVTALIAFLIVFLAPDGDFHNMIKDKILNSVGQIQTMTDSTLFSGEAYCGDGYCVPPETAETCPPDCAPPPPSCDDFGKSECEEHSDSCWWIKTYDWEQGNPGSCRPDRSFCTGHGSVWSSFCNPEEMYCCVSYCTTGGVGAMCVCGACDNGWCGDGDCDYPETVYNCPSDCTPPPCNNNGICEPPGETCVNCSGDCSTGCPSSSTIICGVAYYDNCNSYCGLGMLCPDPLPGCTMECKVGQGLCLESCP